MLKKKWVCSRKDENVAESISRQMGIPLILSQLMVNRGITSAEKAEKFMFPSEKDLHDPFLLKDMDKAVQEILRAIADKRKITIYGDYDVDGVTSCTMLMLFFRAIGVNAEYFIPSRFDGYGLNKDALTKIKEGGGDLVISVDCGTTSVSEVEHANKIGLKMIITDHHTPKDILPNAIAVVNPKRADCSYPSPDLAGVGVAYKLAAGIQKQLKSNGVSSNLGEFLDIVAFGSIADVVPLKGETRTIVRLGLEILNNKNLVRRGFKQLIEVAGLKDKEITAGQVAFYLAPRINALGRLRNVREAVEMFLSDDDELSHATAVLLDKENRERQEIEEKILKEALSKLPPPSEYDGAVIILGDEKWHTGVKGVVASKIVERYHRPTILCSISDGIAHGSARSIEGFDIRKGLEECKDLLLTFGGHTMAAGMSFKEENLDALRKALDSVVRKTLKPEDLVPKVRFDAEVTPSQISLDLVEQLQSLAPFGQGNPTPTFAIKAAALSDIKTMGADAKHLKFKGSVSGVSLNCLAFGKGELSPLLEQSREANLLFTLGVNEWLGKSTLQLEIKDIALKEAPPKPLERERKSPMQKTDTVESVIAFLEKELCEAPFSSTQVKSLTELLADGPRASAQGKDEGERLIQVTGRLLVEAVVRRKKTTLVYESAEDMSSDLSSLETALQKTELSTRLSLDVAEASKKDVVLVSSMENFKKLHGGIPWESVILVERNLNGVTFIPENRPSLIRTPSPMENKAAPIFEPRENNKATYILSQINSIQKTVVFVSGEKRALDLHSFLKARLPHMASKLSVISSKETIKKSLDAFEASMSLVLICPVDFVDIFKLRGAKKIIYCDLPENTLALKKQVYGFSEDKKSIHIIMTKEEMAPHDSKIRDAFMVDSVKEE